jgi:hypothetical protein
VVQSKTTPVRDYRAAMQQLGAYLGAALSRSEIRKGEVVCLGMTVEDADFLGRGAVKSLEEAGAKVSVACFWNERGDAFDLDWAEMAPVVQEYREPAPEKVDHLVILKSVISGACVVRSNLEHLFDDISPRRVHVAAPVMLDGADVRLERGFSKDLAERFEYWTFEVDTIRTDAGEIVPGIGGEIYERLGLGAKATKNSFVPDLVRERDPQAA